MITVNFDERREIASLIALIKCIEIVEKSPIGFCGTDEREEYRKQMARDAADMAVTYADALLTRLDDVAISEEKRSNHTADTAEDSQTNPFRWKDSGLLNYWRKDSHDNV